VQIGELVYKITGDSSQLKREKGKADAEVKGLGTSFKKFAALGVAAFGAVAIAGVAKLGKELITLAADGVESVNAVQVVFGEASEGILDFSENAVRNLGLSSTAFNELSTVIGAQLKQSGVDIDILDDKVIELSTRAADTASVFNVDVNDALLAFGSALRGEAEPARRFGVNISDAAVQVEALATGLVKNKNEITDQIKIQARYNIIMKQTDDLAGDFNNTQGSFTNQLKISKAAVADLGAEIGIALLPMATKTVTAFNKIINALLDSQKEFNNLKDIVSEFKETGEITGSVDDLIEKRDLLLKKQQDYMNDVSLGAGILEEENNRLLVAVEASIKAEERLAKQQEIVDGFNKQAASGAKLAAEQQLKDDEAEAARAAQRVIDIEFRNEIWGRTEAARKAAIQAEIDELETFKKSDVKAQEALAFLRKELAKFNGEVVESTGAVGYWSDAAQTAYNKYKSEQQLAKKEAAERIEQYERINNLHIDAINNATELERAEIEASNAIRLAALNAAAGNEEMGETFDISNTLLSGLSTGFYDLGMAMANGENAALSLGATVLKTTSEILKALGSELIARAAISALIIGVMDPATALIAGGAALVAAGVIGAAATNVSKTAQAKPPSTTQKTTATKTETNTPTRTASGGGTQTINLIVDGKNMAQVTAKYFNNGLVELSQ